MGSPVSPVVANLLAWKKSKNQQFLPQLLLQKCGNAMLTIRFALLRKTYYYWTWEHCQIPFLDTLVSRHNGTIYVDVYRKPKHFNSHHDIKHKESTTATLLHRTFNLPNTTEGRNGEIDKDYSVLQSNGYSSKLIHNITTRRTRSSMIPSP